MSIDRTWKPQVGSALLLLLLLVLPAAAETLYLPVAVDQDVEGKRYRTILWVTNVGDAPAQVELRFIPTGTDGTAGSQRVDRAVTVAPGGTVVLPGSFGPLGMLEVRSDGPVSAVAELNSFVGGSFKASSASVPLVSAATAAPAGSTVDLMALERQIAASQTHLGLVNLEPDAARCTVRAFRPDGSQIAGTAILVVPPLGHREFPGAFGILGEPSIDGARFDVSCDRTFHAYATLLSRFPDTTHYVAPVLRLAGVVDEPGPGDDPGGGSGVILSRNGTFFTAVDGDSLLELDLPLAAGVDYGSVTVEANLYVDRMPTEWFITVVQMRRNVAGGLFWGLNLRGERLKTIIDLGSEATVRGENGVWQERAAHRFRLHYDAAAGTVRAELFRGGQRIELVEGQALNRDLRHDGEGIRLILGQDRVRGGGYFYPPWGFRFSNLTVSASPAS